MRWTSIRDEIGLCVVGYHEEALSGHIPAVNVCPFPLGSSLVSNIPPARRDRYQNKSYIYL